MISMVNIKGHSSTWVVYGTPTKAVRLAVVSDKNVDVRMMDIENFNLYREKKPHFAQFCSRNKTLHHGDFEVNFKGEWALIITNKNDDFAEVKYEVKPPEPENLFNFFGSNRSSLLGMFSL